MVCSTSLTSRNVLKKNVNLECEFAKHTNQPAPTLLCQICSHLSLSSLHEVIPLPYTSICKQLQLKRKHSFDPGSPLILKHPHPLSTQSPPSTQIHSQTLKRALINEYSSFSSRSSSGNRTWRGSTWTSSGCAATLPVYKAESCPTQRACSPSPAAPPKPLWAAWGFSLSPPSMHW